MNGEATSPAPFLNEKRNQHDTRSQPKAAKNYQRLKTKKVKARIYIVVLKQTNFHLTQQGVLHAGKQKDYRAIVHPQRHGWKIKHRAQNFTLQTSAVRYIREQNYTAKIAVVHDIKCIKAEVHSSYSISSLYKKAEVHSAKTVAVHYKKQTEVHSINKTEVCSVNKQKFAPCLNKKKPNRSSI